MRDSFYGYYPPSDNEFEELWSSGLIILDASTLLNLYRYSSPTSGEFIGVLRSLRDRLWIPYQVGLEFQRNRLDVIDQQIQAYDVVLNTISSAQKSIEQELNRYKKHSTLNADELLADYEAATNRIVQKISESKDSHVSSAPTALRADPVWIAVTELLDGRVGQAFDNEELSRIYEEGDRRYSAKTPPGYRDASKEVPDRYGDLVLWKEVLRKVGTEPTTAIFVTDDNKEDWWRIVRGQTLGPRIELIEEFYRSCGRRVHFYGPNQFLTYAKERLSASVSDSSLGEVRQVSDEQAQQQLQRVLMTRRAELLSRKRSTEAALGRVEAGVDRGQRLDAALRQRDMLVNAADSIRRDLDALERFEHDMRSAAENTGGRFDREQLLFSADRAASQRQAMKERLDHLLMETEHLAHTISEMEQAPISDPRRVNTLQARLASISAELEHTEKAMFNLDSDAT